MPASHHGVTIADVDDRMRDMRWNRDPFAGNEHMAPGWCDKLGCSGYVLGNADASVVVFEPLAPLQYDLCHEMTLSQAAFSAQHAGFQALLADERQLRHVLAGAKSPESSWEDWYKYRHFIANEIAGGGRILDVGCANGFLLRCLSEWSHSPVEPHGIDIELASIQAARTLFPECCAQFVQLPAERIGELQQHGLPGRYECIIWNLWWGWNVAAPRTLELARALRELTPEGRVLVAFYGASRDPLGSEAQRSERAATIARARAFRDRLRFGTLVQNPAGGSQALVVLSS